MSVVVRSKTPRARNTEAEVRFVEEGHHTWLDTGRGLRVVSDSQPGRAYLVGFGVGRVGEPVVFSCAPFGHNAYRDGHLDLRGDPGVVPCKHAAGAARRLERQGLVRMDVEGRWCVTEAAAVVPDPDADPFAGMG